MYIYIIIENNHYNNYHNFYFKFKKNMLIYILHTINILNYLLNKSNKLIIKYLAFKIEEVLYSNRIE